MASVIAFWRLPEEEPKFVDYLESTGDVVWVPWSEVPDRSLLVPRPLTTLISEDPDSVLIGLRETLGDLPISVFNDGPSPTYAVVAFDVPMLMYRRGNGATKANSANPVSRVNGLLSLRTKPH